MIYLVRHGQTAFNLERRYQGALDSPLTEAGAAQAARIGSLLGELVSGEGWQVTASPQGRAWRTAEIINQRLALPLERDERLREISLGDWDGLLIEEVRRRAPPDVTVWERQLYAPRGETFEALCERIGAWLADVEGAGRPVIAVSHGMAGRVVRGLYAGLDRAAMLKLEVPQDAVFRLHKGVVERIDCPAAEGVE